MDTYFVHPAILVFADDTGECWIDFLILDAMLDALSLKQGQKLPPDKIALHSLPLVTPTLVLLELQVLEHDPFVLLLCIVDDFLHQTTNVIISFLRYIQIINGEAHGLESKRKGNS